MDISEELRKRLLVHQKNEITEHQIYNKLAMRVRDPENRRMLENIAKDEPFRRRFLEMTGLSLGVATFSFLIGLLLRTFLGIDV